LVEVGVARCAVFTGRGRQTVIGLLSSECKIVEHQASVYNTVGRKTRVVIYLFTFFHQIFHKLPYGNDRKHLEEKESQDAFHFLSSFFTSTFETIMESRRSTRQRRQASQSIVVGTPPTTAADNEDAAVVVAISRKGKSSSSISMERTRSARDRAEMGRVR
jgi:hypothetical protein